jgi:hypothetical protein
VRDDEGKDLNVGSIGKESWLDSRFIGKIKYTGFLDRLGMMYERKHKD